MAIRVGINHRTEYHYAHPVTLSPHIVRLRPAPHCRTPILSYSLRVEPAEHFVNWQQDPFGNWAARYVFDDKTDHLTVEVDLVVELAISNPFDFFIDESARHFPFQYEQQLAKDLSPYLAIDEHGPRLTEWIAALNERAPTSECDSVSYLVNLNQQVLADVAYVVRFEPGVQRCEDTLDKGSGSCRDSAWLLVQVLRHLGLAARFVSGYLVQLKPDAPALDGPSGPTADFTDLHAWAEVFIPGAGWIGLDATSGLLAGEGHIPLSCTPDPNSAAPVTGSTEACETEFSFHNRVERLHEDARVTRPFTPAEWQAVMALGNRVEERLARDDVRLTMGGEPTFVSVDDMDGEQGDA